MAQGMCGHCPGHGPGVWEMFWFPGGLLVVSWWSRGGLLVVSLVVSRLRYGRPRWGDHLRGTYVRLGRARTSFGLTRLP
jgi:hypothetical protein